MLILGIVIAAAICVCLARKSSNRKAAQSGEDKERVRRAVAPLLAEGEHGPILYAHWEEQSSYGRTVRTTYYRYAVSFQDQTLYVIPLRIDKRTHEVQAGQLSVLTSENLGKVIVNTKQKNDLLQRVEVWFCNKQGETKFQLYVDAENLRKTRWYPLNIEQKEECAAFERFVTSLSQHVAAENPGMDDLIKANGNEGAGIIGAIIALIGAVFALFLPPAGVFVSLIGLLLSIVSKVKGAKGKKALIISMICAVWSVGFLWMYLKMYFV